MRRSLYFLASALLFPPSLAAPTVVQGTAVTGVNTTEVLQAQAVDTVRYYEQLPFGIPNPLTYIETQLGDFVGNGEYGSVHELSDDGDVVVKILNAHTPQSIRNEIYALKKMGLFYGYGQELYRNGFRIPFWKRRRPGIYMRRVKGKPIKETHFESREEVDHVFDLARKEVKRMHRKGIVHQDIHGGNLIYDKETNTVRLIDYGLAISLRGMFLEDKLRLKNQDLWRLETVRQWHLEDFNRENYHLVKQQAREMSERKSSFHSPSKDLSHKRSPKLVYSGRPHLSHSKSSETSRRVQPKRTSVRPLGGLPRAFAL